MDTKKEVVTIEQVAKAAGVSKTTISRYINGKYEYMSYETRQKIKNIIEELNYRPNNIARTLKSNKSGFIGAIIADITSQFSSILLKGISDVCKEKGYQVIIANTDNDPVKEIEYVKSLMDNRVEGFVINTTGYNNDYLTEINNSGIPIVLADRIMDELKLDTVTTDDYDITFNTIKFLVNQGYKHIAFFTQPVDKISSRKIRKKAYLDAVKKFFNIDGNEFVYTISTTDNSRCLDGLNDFYKRFKDEPKALFAVNGVTLLNVLHCINECNYNIPEDFGVCGYDDWGWASLIPPGITVISQQSYEVGAESAKRLIKRISSKSNAKPRYKELPARLIIRGSTIVK